MLLKFLILAAAAAPVIATSLLGIDKIKPARNIVENYQNPILELVSPDPQAIYHNGFYYMVLSSNVYPYVNGGILLYKSKTLTDFRGALRNMIYHVPSGMDHLYAPEIHLLDGNMYIYFAMDDGNDDNHRMYVIKADDPNDLMGKWSAATRLYTEDEVDYWAIDGTPVEYNDKLYFVWSGWPGIGVRSPQNLYIAIMCDPMTICGKRVLIREPKSDWEGLSLGAPYALKRADRLFLVFSAQSTWTPDYCLGIMGMLRLGNLTNDPLIPGNWWHNTEGCVFWRNDEENVFGVGHAGFTTSPDGIETWMLFHATSRADDPGTRRIARAEKIEWDVDNNPVFPRPSGDTRLLPVPSGQIQETYTNPIIDGKSADPMLIRIGQYYYFVISTDGERQLTILKSPWLTDFRNAERSIAYIAPPEHSGVWAAEIHMIDGELYMYFTQDRTGESHRNYVIKANNPNDPMAGWGQPIRLMPELNEFAIDGTILQYGGNLYFIFCSIDHNVPMSLYIAPMCDPVTVCGPRVLIKSPRSPWEMHGFPVNEGPFIVQNNNRTFLVFSASSTFTPDYCLGMMGIDGMKDPLVRSNWWDDLDHCMFWRNDAEGIYCTGHAAFTTSPDGTETWMVYHATDDPNTNESTTRIARADRITWADDKAPSFPRPINGPRPVPSGQLPMK